MTLSSYLHDLLSNFKDTRIVQNVTSLVQNMIEHTSIRLWSISKDKAEFDRSKRLLSGSLQSVLDEQKVSDALRVVGLQQIQAKWGETPPELLVLLHDPCDIRKKYAEELENLGTVRSLDGQLIPGYQTFDTVVVTERGTSPQPLDTTVYSNGDPHYVTEEELKQFHHDQRPQSKQEQHQGQGQKPKPEPEQTPKLGQERYGEIQRFLDEDSYVNLKRVLKRQLSRVSQQMQAQFPDTRRCHVLDRQFDGVPYFELIGLELQDDFVIRAKGSRNSNEVHMDEVTGKRITSKLNTVAFAHHHRYGISKIRLKHTTYQNVTCHVEWDTLRLNETNYTVVRVTLSDRNARPLFAEPMMLITNMSVATADDACRIYRLYLLRAKIEGVFKFCKMVLGWEDFQVRDYTSIRHLLALTYFVAGYFYAIDSVLIDNPVIALICQLGGGKGVVSRYFFLHGLQKLLVYQAVLQFIHTHQVGETIFQDMMDFVT